MHEPRLRADVLWSDLFPGLQTARDVGRLPDLLTPWLDRTPAEAGVAGELSNVCQHMATVMLDNFATSSLGTLIPSLPGLGFESFPYLPARASRALQSLLAEGDVRACAPADIMDMRQVGRGSAIEIMAACLHVAAIWGETSTRFVVTPIPNHDSQPVQAVPALIAEGNQTQQPAKPVENDESQIDVLEDLSVLARWQLLRGASGASIIKPVLDEGPVPDAVAQAQERLATLTADQIVPPGDRLNVTDELDYIITELSQREYEILVGRYLKVPQTTFEELGTVLGVTRERVRQLQKKLDVKIHDWTKFGTPVGDFMAVLRAEIQPIASLKHLVERHPNLGAEVNSVGRPLWFVLDRLDDAFEVVDEWAAAPSIQSAKELTNDMLEDLEDRHGVVSLVEFQNSIGNMIEAELVQDWLEFCGFDMIDAHILLRASSIPDRVVALLAIAGNPLTLECIISRIPDRSVNSIRNALSIDNRVSRINKDSWALAEWGQEDYTTIRELISRRLEKAPEGIEINQLIYDLAKTFNLAESSIRAYASAPPFITEGGLVRRLTGHQETRLKTPAETRRLYRNGLEWIYRFTVTRDHLRGSGFSIPRGVADVIGCKAGDVLALNSQHGPVTFRWTGTQPTCGSIRGSLLAQSAKEGDQALIRIQLNDMSAEVEKLGSQSRTEKNIQVILTLMGQNIPSNPTLTHIAEGLSLPPASDALEIAQVFKDRGEDDMFGIICAHIETNSLSQEPNKMYPAENNTDELLDLLGL